MCLNILLDACVKPETVCPMYKYSFILADKKNEIDYFLLPPVFSWNVLF